MATRNISIRKSANFTASLLVAGLLSAASLNDAFGAGGGGHSAAGTGGRGGNTSIGIGGPTQTTATSNKVTDYFTAPPVTSPTTTYINSYQSPICLLRHNSSPLMAQSLPIRPYSFPPVIREQLVN